MTAKKHEKFNSRLEKKYLLFMENGAYTELKKAKGFFSELLKNNV